MRKAKEHMTQDELKKMRRASYIKMVAMFGFVVAVMAFGSIAWFTMSREVEGSDVQMTSNDNLFEIKTTGQTGLYDSYISRVDPKYSNATQTSNSNQKITWHLSKGNYDTEGNMNNLYTGEGTPDLSEITKLDSSDYGLSPGDYGTLKFSIVPKTTGAFSVEIHTDMTCFKTEYYESGANVGYQKDVFTEIAENSSNHAILQYAHSHITFYYEADEDNDDTPELHLIKNGMFTIENITEETEVTIYWVWAKNLANIVDANVDGLDENGATELRDSFFVNPSSFLEDPSGVATFNTIIVDSDSENFDDDVADKVDYLKAIVNKSEYNGYKTMYNNADQTIGDRVGYIMFTMTADLKND